MKINFRKWIPIALCCLPGVAVAAIVGVGLTAGGAAAGTWLGGPLGLGLIALALLSCPVSMGLMMMRQRGPMQQSMPGNSATVMDCCLPTQDEEASTSQLASLRAKRESLEHELAELQAK